MNRDGTSHWAAVTVCPIAHTSELRPLARTIWRRFTWTRSFVR